MKNKYEVRGDVTVIFLKRKDGTAIETIIETTDLDLLLSFTGTWHADNGCNSRKFYVKGNIKLEDGKWSMVKLHRWLLGNATLQVDHINHDTLDNRRSNLREVTNEQNCQNRNGAYSNSKSGIRGVFLYKPSNKWRAQVSGMHLGTFDTMEEAEQSVVEARAKYMPYSQEALTF